jgi:hypothetical protein
MSGHTSSAIVLTLMMEEPPYSDTSVITRAKRRNIPDDAILHSTAVKTSNLTLAAGVLIS